MKADKKAIDQLSNFGKAIYFLGCISYSEENKGEELSEKRLIKFNFTMRLWHPLNILLIFIAILYSVSKEVYRALKLFVRDKKVGSGEFLRNQTQQE